MAKTIERETARNGAAVVNRNIHTAALQFSELNEQVSVSAESIGFDQQMADVLKSEDLLLESAMSRLLAMIQHRESVLERMKLEIGEHLRRKNQQGYRL